MVSFQLVSTPADPGGEFSNDKPLSADSLASLEALVKRHPSIDVRLGHQPRGQEIVPAR